MCTSTLSSSLLSFEIQSCYVANAGINSLSSLSVPPKGWDPLCVLLCHPQAGYVCTDMLGWSPMCALPCLVVGSCVYCYAWLGPAFHMRRLNCRALASLGVKWRWKLPPVWWTEKAAQEQLLLLSESRSQHCPVLLTVLVLDVFFSIWPGRS